uniref:Transposase n=1 Tax=Streptococcus suis TaxID=1307 RepID=G8DU25_STRSU|nr:transposase [Streptococcus suis]FAA00989.1 TPA: hypothetical protein [Streptococcus suis]
MGLVDAVEILHIVVSVNRYIVWKNFLVNVFRGFILFIYFLLFSLLLLNLMKVVLSVIILDIASFK